MEEQILIDVQNITKSFQHWDERSYSFKKILNQLFTFKLKRSKPKVITVLENISFHVRRGEFVGIMGRNGIGKSTILKIISKIYHPNKGSVKVNAKIASLLELGAGFEGELTGYENIFLYASMLGYGRNEIINKTDEIIKFSGLDEKINQPIKNYSSGMLVRLGFSIAAHLEAKILLFDEVLAVGDIAFQEKCINKILELHKEGRAIVLVTHSPEQVERFCDRCILFNNKSIIFDGDAKVGAQKYREIV